VDVLGGRLGWTRVNLRVVTAQPGKGLSHRSGASWHVPELSEIASGELHGMVVSGCAPDMIGLDGVEWVS
jgi:hypothetical protein